MPLFCSAFMTSVLKVKGTEVSTCQDLGGVISCTVKQITSIISALNGLNEVSIPKKEALQI